MTTLPGLSADQAAAVRRWFPGAELVADRGLRLLATTYRQAGRLLAVLYAEGSRVDPDHQARDDARALAWLERPHRIDIVDRLRAELTTQVASPCRLVPTHGDWQPRNWIVDGGRVCVIDFGRADWRPAETDLAGCRMSTAPALSISWNPDKVNSCSPPEIGTPTRLRM